MIWVQPLILGALLFMEVWKDIEGFEGYYQVSNIGRVKSLERSANGGRGGKGKRLYPEKMLSIKNKRRGYLYVELNKNCTGIKFSIHRLVAKTFIPNLENKDQVNHKNGIKTDNRVENLEWATGSENIIHAFKTGLKSGIKGEKRSDSKLTEKEAIEIKYGNKNKSYSEIGANYGVSAYAVYSIRCGRTWKHI